MNLHNLPKEYIFNCGHCGSKYIMDNIQIYGYPSENPKIIVCEGCYGQLTNQSGKGGIS